MSRRVVEPNRRTKPADFGRLLPTARLAFCIRLSAGATSFDWWLTTPKPRAEGSNPSAPATPLKGSLSTDARGLVSPVREAGPKAQEARCEQIDNDTVVHRSVDSGGAYGHCRRRHVARGSREQPAARRDDPGRGHRPVWPRDAGDVDRRPHQAGPATFLGLVRIRPAALPADPRNPRDRSHGGLRNRGA